MPEPYTDWVVAPVRAQAPTRCGGHNSAAGAQLGPANGCLAGEVTSYNKHTNRHTYINIYIQTHIYTNTEKQTQTCRYIHTNTHKNPHTNMHKHTQTLYLHSFSDKPGWLQGGFSYLLVISLSLTHLGTLYMLSFGGSI